MSINRVGYRLILAGVLLLPTPAHSQTVLVGAKVAARISSTFPSTAPTTVNEDWGLFGPMAAVQVTPNFMLEVNALYKRKFNYTNVFTHVNATVQLATTTNVSAHSWEIPLLLKYRFPEHNRIFVGGGFAARNIVGTTHMISTQELYPLHLPPTTISETRSSDGDIVHHWTYGPVLAVGADLHAYKLHFQPELRYTRWNAKPFPYPMDLNAFEALIGIAVGK